MKTYEECKDEVAKKYNIYFGIPYKDWSEMEKSLGSIRRGSTESLNNLFSRFEEAALLYAQELVGEAIVLAREVKDGSYEIKNISDLKYTEQEIKDKLFKQ